MDHVVCAVQQAVCSLNCFGHPGECISLGHGGCGGPSTLHRHRQTALPGSLLAPLLLLVLMGACAW